MIAHDIKNHEGHDVVPDEFAKLAGVTRYEAGNLYCLTCHSPIPVMAEPEEAEA